MRDKDYVLSPAHQEQLWRKVSEPWKVAAAQFVSAFVELATRHQVPVYCRYNDGNRVELVHAQYEDRLGDDDWVILSQIGDEVIAQTLLRATWSGEDGGNPAEWVVEPARASTLG